VGFINLQHILPLPGVWNFLHDAGLQESLVLSYSSLPPNYIIASSLQCYREEPLRLGEMHACYTVSHCWLHTVASLRGPSIAFESAYRIKTPHPIVCSELLRRFRAAPLRQSCLHSYWQLRHHSFTNVNMPRIIAFMTCTYLIFMLSTFCYCLHIKYQCARNLFNNALMILA
jgi:hypothetical protein